MDINLLMVMQFLISGRNNLKYYSTKPRWVNIYARLWSIFIVKMSVTKLWHLWSYGVQIPRCGLATGRAMVKVGSTCHEALSLFHSARRWHGPQFVAAKCGMLPLLAPGAALIPGPSLSPLPLFSFPSVSSVPPLCIIQPWHLSPVLFHSHSSRRLESLKASEHNTHSRMMREREMNCNHMFGRQIL